MTKMLRRSDVIALVAKRLSHQWGILDCLEQPQDRNMIINTSARIDEMRILRGILTKMPSFVATEYACAETIPHPTEWAERVRLAGEATDAPNAADPAMMRLLADLRIPLEVLHEREEAAEAA